MPHTGFSSPVSNHRTDKYGESLSNRLRYPLEVTKAIREAWPAQNPLFYRVSATDWDQGDEKRS
jgi:anthraniloyl-CoA monooxygenase